MSDATSIHRNAGFIGQTDWSDPESVARCSRLMWESRGYKSDLEERTYRNEQFLWGKHWYWWDGRANDGVGGMVPRRDVAGWQTRLVYNEILSTVEQRTAKLIRANRVWTPVVATEDERDRVTQRLQSQVMEYGWTDGIKMPKKLRTALQWAMSSPVLFGRPFWNRRKGPRMEVPLDRFVSGRVMREMQMAGRIDPLVAQDAERRAKNEFWQVFGQNAFQSGLAAFNAGDVDVDICPIYEVSWWPFYAKSWDQVRVWQWTRKITVEEAAEDLGIPKDKVREMAHPSAMNSALRTGHTSEWGNRYFYDDEIESTLQEDSVLRHVLYKEPTDEFPNGRMAVHLGFAGESMFLDDLQTVVKRCPIVPLVEKPVRGNAPGTCIVDQMVPVNENYNRAASQVSDYCKRKIMPTMVEFPGSNLNQGQSLSNAPGKIYKASGPDKIPQSIQLPDIGFDYFNTMNIDRSWMRDLGGIAAIDVGKTDGADVKSGRAILALKEQNDLRLVPFGEAIDEWVEALGNFILPELQEKVSDQRVVHLIGENNELEVVSFRGDDLKPSNHGSPGANERPIRVRAHSIIPRSPQEMLAIFNIAIEAGFLGPQHANDFFDALGLQEFRKSFDQTRGDSAKQSDEIEKWRRGELVGPPNEADNDQVHLKILERWMITQEFTRIQQLARLDTRMMMVLQDVLDHRDAHRAQFARDVAEQKYNMLDADLSMWMKHRAQWAEKLAQQGINDPAARSAVGIAYSMPLALVGAGGGSEQQSPQGSGSEGKQEPKDKKKSPMPNGESPNQGVRNDEKVAA